MKQDADGRSQKETEVGRQKSAARCGKQPVAGGDREKKKKKKGEEGKGERQT